MAKKRSWKTGTPIMPGFLSRAITKGLKMADSIGIEEADDKSWLMIKFKKYPATPPDPKE